jgi:UDP-glucose 4-epimerase
MKRSVLITGAAGFLGRYVARHFFERGYRVVGVDSSPPENTPSERLAVYHQFRLPDSNLLPLLRDDPPELCIHCAGRASVGLSMTHPAGDYYGNAALTFEVLELLRNVSPRCRFVLLSSAAVYGNPVSLPVGEDQPTRPISPYGFHKHLAEHICREFHSVYGIPTASVRIFSAYGPGLRRQVVWDLCRKAIECEQLELQGTGEETRDFIHAKDVARGLDVVLHHAPMRGEAYNLAMGVQVSIANLAAVVLRALNLDRKVIFSGENAPGNPLRWHADITKLSALGFRPSVDLEQGIQSFAGWSREEILGV